MSEGRHSDILSEGYRSDEAEYGSDTDPDVRDTELDIDLLRQEEAFARRMTGEVQATRRLLARESRSLDRINPDAEILFDVPLVDASDIVPDETTPLLDQSRRAVDRAHDNAKVATDAAKKSTKRRWIYIVIGLTIAGGLGYAVYELIRRSARKEGSHDLDVPDDVRKAVADLVAKWSDQTDGAFWTDMADAIDAGLTVGGQKLPYTIADQLVFLNLTIETNPLRTLWLWPSAKDIEANAEGILAFYAATGKLSDIYRHVLEVKGNNGGEMQVMPRAVAAGQLRIVLGWILGGKTIFS